MSEQMRSEFEAWAKTRSLSLVKYGGGMYVCDKTMWAEIGWQASRAALCVELPRLSDQTVEDHYNWSACEQKCKEAIHAAGVKTK